jgi:hypothetical protein
VVKVAGVLVVVILAASACGTTKTKASELSDPRVCRDEAYNSDDSVCTWDEKAAPLTSRTIHCAARVARSRKGERFRGRVFYEGVLLAGFSLKLPAIVNTVETHFSGGDDPVPRGHYVCELRLGTQTVRESFRSGAPERPISGVAACPTDAAVVALGRAHMRICKPGVEPTFPTAHSVTCSAALLHATGKTAQVKLLYKDRPLAEDSYRLPLPLSVLGVQFFATRANAKLPAGPYVCVFSVAGKELARRSFTITG